MSSYFLKFSEACLNESAYLKSRVLFLIRDYLADR